eukprot:1157301-Pelagomonas_calceolata.AAC.2
MTQKKILCARSKAQSPTHLSCRQGRSKGGPENIQRQILSKSSVILPACGLKAEGLAAGMDDEGCSPLGTDPPWDARLGVGGCWLRFNEGVGVARWDKKGEGEGDGRTPE